MNDINFGPCPHCGSAEIICVPSGTADGYQRSGMAVSTFRAIPFSRVICLQCGSVREWITDRAHLDLLRQSSPPRGEFGCPLIGYERAPAGPRSATRTLWTSWPSSPASRGDMDELRRLAAAGSRDAAAGSRDAAEVLAELDDES